MNLRCTSIIIILLGLLFGITVKALAIIKYKHLTFDFATIRWTQTQRNAAEMYLNSNETRKKCAQKCFSSKVTVIGTEP